MRITRPLRCGGVLQSARARLIYSCNWDICKRSLHRRRRPRRNVWDAILSCGALHRPLGYVTSALCSPGKSYCRARHVLNLLHTELALHAVTPVMCHTMGRVKTLGSKIHRVKPAASSSEKHRHVYREPYMTNFYYKSIYCERNKWIFITSLS